MPAKVKKNKTAVTFIIELPFLIVIAFLLAWVIKSVVIQPFYIPSGSMEPTLYEGDQVLVNKYIYRFKEPSFGEIIVFKYPVDTKKDFIKRVIATEGYELEIKAGQVFINGRQVQESYIAAANDSSDYGPIKVPEGNIFVMGDNRASSFDSRLFGLVPRENVIGRAFIIYWPPGRMGMLENVSE